MIDLLLPKLQKSCVHSSVGHVPSALPNQKGTMEEDHGSATWANSNRLNFKRRQRRKSWDS